jgi:hypothetical protein
MNKSYLKQYLAVLIIVIISIIMGMYLYPIIEKL